MTTYDQLLESAREQYAVPAMPLVNDVVAFLTSLGAVPLDLHRYRKNLIDEYVDPELATIALTLHAPQLLHQRAIAEELENFGSDVDPEYDPLEYGEINKEWTVFSHELEELSRIHVVLERADLASERAGNFRVHGGAQWLRETLWAATGVVPRDPGYPTRDSALFRQAFPFAGRASFTGAPVE
ncbi:hypothetical protein [Microbacterium sp. EST19A]|uniref:hypothetical protein n=1 Tax=Microbacterium sp. EST19A TaxID=2862681 RepID=UPI001CBF912D|nr:hypothetical protein [Microbacterium sp. EST19A]